MFEVHPLIFLCFFSNFLNVFMNNHEYENKKIFIYNAMSRDQFDTKFSVL